MKHFLATTSLGAFIALSGTGAFALTADEVWAKYQGLMNASSGTTITTGEAVRAGNVLTVPAVKGSTATDVVSLDFSIDSIALTENSDGSVTMATSETIPVFMSIDDGDDAVKMQFELVQTNAVTTITGTVDAMSFASTADSFVFNLTELLAPGEDVPVTLSVTMRDLASTSVVDADDAQSSTFSSSALAIDFSAADPSSDESVEMTAIANALKGEMRGDANAMAFLADPSAVAGGVNAAFSYGYESLQGEGQFNADGMEGSFSMTVGKSGVAYQITPDALTTKSTMGGLDVDVKTNALPFPVQIKMADASSSIAVPLKKDTRGPVEFGFRMADLTVNDEIWMMGDPGNALPHDPITLDLKLTGEAELAFDVIGMDPEALERLETPGKIYALNLETLLLSAVGAEVTGEGAFTFDNNQMGFIPGMPKPEGNLSVNMSGANALMEALVKMGLIQDSDLGPVRMMMGMVTQPGDGPDTLKSDVEINAEGHLMVNGVRMQ